MFLEVDSQKKSYTPHLKWHTQKQSKLETITMRLSVKNLAQSCGYTSSVLKRGKRH